MLCDRILQELDRALQRPYFAARVTQAERDAVGAVLRAAADMRPDPVEPQQVLRDLSRSGRDRDRGPGSARSRPARAAGDHAADGVRAVRPSLARRLRQPLDRILELGAQEPPGAAQLAAGQDAAAGEDDLNDSNDIVGQANPGARCRASAIRTAYRAANH